MILTVSNFLAIFISNAKDYFTLTRLHICLIPYWKYPLWSSSSSFCYFIRMIIFKTLNKPQKVFMFISSSVCLPLFILAIYATRRHLRLLLPQLPLTSQMIFYANIFNRFFSLFLTLSFAPAHDIDTLPYHALTPALSPVSAALFLKHLPLLLLTSILHLLHTLLHQLSQRFYTHVCPHFYQTSSSILRLQF